MDFLQRELDGLPQPAKEALLKELEAACRDIHAQMRDGDLNDFTMLCLCVKIGNILSISSRLRSALENREKV